MSASTCKHFLPGFRATCLTVSVIYVLLGGSILARGVRASMGPYAVPEQTIASPHYGDAIFWVYLHMMVIGAIVGVVGLTAEGDRLKLWFSRLLFAAHVVYTTLDVRSSDSFLGNGLYRGPGSVFPAIICLVVTILFAHLALCRAARADTSRRSAART